MLQIILNLIKNIKCLIKNILFSSNDLYDYLLKLIKSYPIISIEDPFAEEDIDYFKKLKESSPSYLQIVGDDLVVTNTN